MNVACIGISHQTAPVELRERFAVGKKRLPEVLACALARGGIEEAVLVSTCNRVELYTAGSSLPDAALLGMDHSPAGMIYRLKGAPAVEHLFRVSSGLESMVIGETEILGQVKDAYAQAFEHGATGRVLNRLFQRAFQAAKHARSSTGITRGAVSVGSVAVALAARVFGDLRRRRIMILGAGETSELTARCLLARGARSIIVSNRSAERAAALAKELGGETIPFQRWTEQLHEVDILISSTAAPHLIVKSSAVVDAMKQRGGRPLFMMDLAVPRDIDADVYNLAGVHLYDIDSLQGIAQDTLRVRRGELARCGEIVQSHVRAFMEWLRTEGMPCNASAEFGHGVRHGWRPGGAWEPSAALSGT
jgi:glutamyl-tRNA reductase